MTGNEIREMFLRYFEGQGHRRVRSSSLVPIGDPTLLFTNAGMNQFKDVFLGLETRDYKRATTVQKCVRAGGKHNDLENVGFTKRHHTFFEMLGNFSFGDYFKKEAIEYAWELITSPKWFSIPVGKLYFTVFGGAEVAPGNTLGKDAEAAELWIKVGAPRERVIPVPGLKENFWAMGDTGPCGPCSEIHYDMGPAASEQGHADCKFPCDCGRYVEIWNLVFMQFNRDDSGRLTPLPKPCVDTGMGLERVACVLQGVISNYDTDFFRPLMLAAAQHAGVDREKLEIQPSLRIIADHSRAATFLISDGVIPSNEGRGYVLRKIIRRSLRHIEKLNPNAERPFLSFISSSVLAGMKSAYPELEEHAARVIIALDAEESRFSRTMDAGIRKLREEFAKQMTDGLMTTRPGRTLKEEKEKFRRAFERADDTAAGKLLVLPGEVAFRLYDTFGLPLDFIRDACRDEGISFDQEGFERAMAEQKTRARASWKGGAKEAANPAYAKLAETFKTEPDFYQGTNTRDCRIEAIITKSGPVNEIKAGDSAEVVLDRTVIYAESGGQVSDIGAFYDNSESLELATVTGAYYPVAGLVAHKIAAKETLRVGDRVAVVADAARREHIKRNHTGTHLVHAALRNILGTHVKQAGSLNSPEGLRFDFSHFSPVDPEELRDIEQQVNEEIRLNAEIVTSITPLEDALNSGALAFFGDKYPEHSVRVVTIPDPQSLRGFYSKELCGGTHVHRSGDIGVFKIVSEQSVASGVRRIEAVTGSGALESYQRAATLLTQLSRSLNIGEDALQATLEKLNQTVRQLEKQLETQKRKGALSLLDDLVSQAQIVKGVKVVAAEVQGVDREGLRQLVDSLRQRLGSAVVALGTAEDSKVALITGVTKDLTAKSTPESSSRSSPGRWGERGAAGQTWRRVAERTHLP